MTPPAWYRLRSAVFFGIYAVGFLAGWAASVALHGRYVAAFAELGSGWGSRGVAIAAAGALAIALGAWALRVWGASYLSAPTVWDENIHTEALVEAGPFGFVRHPLYLGNILLALGLGAAAPVAGWAFIVVASLLFVAALIKHEETGLQHRHGAAYERYRAAVPALVPRMPRRGAHKTTRPSLAQGLRAEAFTGFLIAGVVGIVAVPRYGAAVFAACYLAGIVVQNRIEKRSTTA